MSVECAHLIDQALNRLKLEFDCQPEGRGASVVTPYLHPDNSLVEVFVVEEDGGLRVSDQGETLRRLKLQGADPLATTKGRFMAEQTVARLHVNLIEGRVERAVGHADAAEALLDVAAAAQALGGLIYTSRSMEPASFPQEVGSFLREHKVDFAARKPLDGQSGRVYRVGFCYSDPATGAETVLEPLSPSGQGGMTRLVDKTVRMWVDLDVNLKRVSLLNDIHLEWRSHDEALLGRFSTVARWSEKERILDAA